MCGSRSFNKVISYLYALSTKKKKERGEGQTVLEFFVREMTKVVNGISVSQLTRKTKYDN